jgi:hypothetical protein
MSNSPAALPLWGSGAAAPEQWHYRTCKKDLVIVQNLASEIKHTMT